MNTEQKRKRIELAVKLVGLGIAGFIVAPFVFIAIKGLVGLVLAALFGWAVVWFTPVVATTLANWRLKALKAEASRNPVETLQNDYIKRREKLGEFREAIKTFMAEIENFADKLSAFAKQYPQEAPKFKSNLEKMKQLLSLRQNKYKQAERQLEAYELEIQKAGAIWEMGQAAAAMNQAAGMTEEDFMAKVMVETALDSVQKNLNSALAELEVSLLEESESAHAPKLVTEGVEPAVDYLKTAPPPRTKVLIS